MSKIKNNPLLSKASGLLGDTVVFREVHGQMQMANRPPKRKGKATEKQAVVQRKFRDAAQYGKRQISDPTSNVLYATGITETKHSAYLVAMNDYLIAPIVDSIDTVSYLGAIGDSIVAIAVDDFMVTKVLVVITNAAGAIIEQGEAVADAMRSNQWEYKATAANSILVGTKIKAIAYDRPGNTGTLEVVL